MSGTGSLLAVALLLATCSAEREGPAEDAQAKPPRDARERFERLLPPRAPSSDIVFVGKAFCSVRRDVSLPFSAVISSLEVKPGDPVKKGQALGRFRLTPKAVRQISTAISGRQGESELRLLSEELGTSVTPGSAPRDGAVVSPIDGYVLWVHPDFRPGVEMESTGAVFKVGVMDPMVVRANVYEADARRLKSGDEVTIRPETRTDWQLRAEITQVAWSPVSADSLEPSYYAVECRVENSSLVLREGMRILVHAYRPPEGK